MCIRDSRGKGHQLLQLLARQPGVQGVMRQLDTFAQAAGVIGSIAVSYTHLDVYKRQVSEFPKAPIHLWKVLSMSRPGKVLRVASN